MMCGGMVVVVVLTVVVEMSMVFFTESVVEQTLCPFVLLKSRKFRQTPGCGQVCGHDLALGRTCPPTGLWWGTNHTHGQQPKYLRLGMKLYQIK
jgi:hypothetical protein